MTWTLNKIILLVAVICLAVAFIITAGWVDGHGNDRDVWFTLGVLLGFASFLP